LPIIGGLVPDIIFLTVPFCRSIPNRINTCGKDALYTDKEIHAFFGLDAGKETNSLDNPVGFEKLVVGVVIN